MNDRASVSQVRMQQWANIIRNQKESGLTIDAFCEANNISKNRFFYWQKKIRETAIQAVGNRFVEVTTPVNNQSEEFFPKSGCIEFIKHEYHVEIYAGKHGEGIVRADRPERLLSNSILTPALAAAIFNAKYVNAVPLNRLSEEFKRHDIIISRQTMAGWMIRLTERYLGPVYRAMIRNFFPQNWYTVMKHHSNW